MKTDKQILARMEEVKADDFFGTTQSDLINYLPYQHAKPFLKEGVTEEQWKPTPRDEDSIKGEIRSYLDFAWGKANDCRGLSASRSIDHMRAWFWMLGRDDLVTRFGEVYEFYGKPCLVLASEAVGFDWRAVDDGCWQNDEGGMDATTPDKALAAHGIELASVPA